MKRGFFLSTVAVFLFALEATRSEEPALEGLTIVPGPINGALIERGGKALAIYGDPRPSPAPAETVLFTHHRRDVVWAGAALVERGAKAVVPAAEADLFAKADQFWVRFADARFHDYAQQTTKVLAAPLPAARPLAVDRMVRGGETFVWEGLPIRVVETPGYTRGAVSYLIELEGKTVAFTGDLIHGDGKLFDLYSLQDAIPEAKIGGYHGYAARLGELVASLRKIAAENPAVLVPARGPLIRDPRGSIERLIRRIEALYANYLSTDALRWYFGDEHIQAKARRVLGPDAKVDWMSKAETRDLPPWIIPIENSRLVLSAAGRGLLVDCGGQGILDAVKKMRGEGKLAAIDHVFITHYHDDHTDRVAALVEAFGCTVLSSLQSRDVLENPGAYRLPCLTRNPIHVSAPLPSGATWRWQEFELTLHYFPGQTILHDALLVKKDGGETVFFAGDSFTPCGMDDYCLPNRNILHRDAGYFRCLDLLAKVPRDAWIINQHVEPAFRFSEANLRFMVAAIERRVELLRNLLPWPDPNFGIDEGWASMHPHATEARPGETLRSSLKITNHLSREEAFRIDVHLPKGWTLRSLAPNPILIPPRQEGSVKLEIAVPPDAPKGPLVLTADIQWAGVELREWAECLVTVQPGK